MEENALRALLAALYIFIFKIMPKCNNPRSHL